MELRNVTTFLKAAQLGNFTRTAEELGYAPSTITMQIKQLEEELGFPLFDRIGRKISLTALGGQFLSYAKLMESLSEKVMLLGKESLQISGTVRIGILESLFASVLLPLLPEYSKRFPSVTLEFKTASTAELLAEPYLEIDNTGFIINLVKQGLGISFLPEYAVQASAAAGKLIILDVDVQSVQFFSQLFYYKNKWISPQLKGLIELICDGQGCLIYS